MGVRMKWRTRKSRRFTNGGKWVTRFAIFPRRSDDGFTYWLERIKVFKPFKKIMSFKEWLNKFV